MRHQLTRVKQSNVFTVRAIELCEVKDENPPPLVAIDNAVESFWSVFFTKQEFQELINEMQRVCNSLSDPNRNQDPKDIENTDD